MTSISHRYADFSPFGPDGELIDSVPLERVEDQKLEAFEEGYQAGWTDAERNHESEHKNVAEEILNTLRDLSFTYEEAVAQVNRGLKPMFEQVIKALLPPVATAGFRAHVIRQLVDLSEKQTETRVTIRVSDRDFSTIEEILEQGNFKLPVSVVEDSTLTLHQLFVSIDNSEREINLSAVCDEITAAMTAFNFHSERELNNE